MTNGESTSFSGPVSRFIGIYSGRINSQSDLGMVWKASAIEQLVSSIGLDDKKKKELDIRRGKCDPKGRW